MALARWLATRPAVLILDEPTQGVDVGAKAEIHRLMGDLAAEGLAILMISSELPEILGMSDRIGGHARRHDRGRHRSTARAATQERLLALALGHGETGGGLVTSMARRDYRRELGRGARPLALLLASSPSLAPSFFRPANLRDLAGGQRARAGAPPSG